jgi:hypothetical protein
MLLVVDVCISRAQRPCADDSCFLFWWFFYLFCGLCFNPCQSWWLHNVCCIMFCCNCLAMFCSQCSVRNVLFAMFCSQCSVRNVLFAMFCLQCSVRNVLFAMFCSQCSVRNVLFAIVSTLDSSHGHHWVLQTQNRGGGSWCPLVQVLHGRRRSGRARWPWVRG